MTDEKVQELRQAAAHVQSYKKNVDALAEAWKQDRDRVYVLTQRVDQLQATISMLTQQLQQLQQQVALAAAASRGRGGTT